MVLLEDFCSELILKNVRDLTINSKLMKKHQRYSDTGNSNQSTVGVPQTTRPIHYKLYINTISSTVKLFVIETDPVHQSFRQEVLLKLFRIDLYTALLEHSRANDKTPSEGSVNEVGFHTIELKKGHKTPFIMMSCTVNVMKGKLCAEGNYFFFYKSCVQMVRGQKRRRAQKPNGEIIVLIITIFNPQG